MKKQNGPMQKKIISFMHEKIKNQNIDLEKMLNTDQEKLIDFLHSEYKLAEQMIKNG